MNINKKSLPLILLIIIQPFFLVLLNISNFNAKAYPLGSIVAHNFVIGVLAIIMTVMALVFVRKVIEVVEKETEARLQVENLKNINEMVQTMRSQRHDFNNHIQTVYGLMSLGLYEDSKKYMGEVIVPIQASNKILSDNPSVTALLQVKANRAESKRIKTDFILRGNLKETLIPVQDLNTILGNLLDNAIEAVEGSVEPKLIKTELLSKEDKLLIAVENTGPKLPEQVLENIFQPGFTTKNYGQGMGLWSINKIVEAYSGSIEVKNEDNGIRFEICFNSCKS